jgi:hypothetical protein
MRLLAVPVLALTLLGGCGEAGAANVDPADDVHCSVLAFYFHGFAKHQGVPANQLRATKVMHEWYAAKVRDVAVERWGGTDGFQKEIGPLLEAVKKDPKAMADEMVACTDRAIAAEGFNQFARRIGG